MKNKFYTFPILFVILFISKISIAQKQDSLKRNFIGVRPLLFITEIGLTYEHSINKSILIGTHLAYVYPNKKLAEVPVVIFRTPTLYYTGISTSFYLKKFTTQNNYKGLLFTFKYKYFEHRELYNGGLSAEEGKYFTYLLSRYRRVFSFNIFTEESTIANT